MPTAVSDLTPRALRFAVYCASVVVIVAGLKAAAPVLKPLALAGFIAAASLPALQWLRQRGVPTAFAILAIVLIDTLILSSLVWIVLQTLAELRNSLPTYVGLFQQVEQSARLRLLGWGIEITPEYYATLMQADRLLDVAATTARNVTSALAVFFLLLLFVVFILAESVVLPRKLQIVFGHRAAGVTGAAAVLKQVQRYLGLKTLISLATGLLIGLGASLIGVDLALFWGLLAFVLNYIPNVGSIIAGVPAVALALLQLGPGPAFALFIVYVVVNIVVGSFIDPIVVGRQLRLAPIMVLLSLVFWGWTWGPVGMFLAVPLTIALRIILENTTSLSKIAALMGPVAEPVAMVPARSVTPVRES